MSNVCVKMGFDREGGLMGVLGYNRKYGKKVSMCTRSCSELCNVTTCIRIRSEGEWKLKRAMGNTMY